MKHDSDDYPIRMATRADEEVVMELCRMLHEENGQFPMSEEKVRNELRRGFDRQGGVVAVIDGPEGTEAVSLLTIDQPWYSDVWMLQECFIFVHPDHRKTRHAKRLINYARECADKMGIPLLIGVLSNHKTEAKVKLYERVFGAKAGAYFLHDGSGGVH
ncbi:GNAT family N-acetyltransferase [Boseaceae bacterium BT-24-1]|nr:GNAT family N-acetyltransferase [Boseaceae bacterium BT-24-1]